jgi:predicted oxidoreductase
MRNYGRLAAYGILLTKTYSSHGRLEASLSRIENYYNESSDNMCMYLWMAAWHGGIVSVLGTERPRSNPVRTERFFRETAVM